jgi:hypothetical protein
MVDIGVVAVVAELSIMGPHLVPALLEEKVDGITRLIIETVMAESAEEEDIMCAEIMVPR